MPRLVGTQDPRADELLGRDPLALLLQMLFDRRVLPEAADRQERLRVCLLQ